MAVPLLVLSRAGLAARGILPTLSRAKSILPLLGKSWGKGKEAMHIAPIAMEAINALFLDKKKEREGIMSSVFSRGFSGFKDVLQLYTQKHEFMGDLAVITENIFQKKENKTIFDKLAMAFLIIEKIPFLGSFVEGKIASIPGFMECVALIDMLLGTTFKADIEKGDMEAVSQAVKVLIQLGDLIMTQVNMANLEGTLARK